MANAEKLKEKFLEYRFHVISAAACGVAVFYLLRLGPSFLTVVSFFRPLLLSTSAFLAAVLVLRLISPPPAVVLSEQTGERLMDYVAGHGRADENRKTHGVGEEVRDRTAATAGDQPRSETPPEEAKPQ